MSQPAQISLLPEIPSRWSIDGGVDLSPYHDSWLPIWLLFGLLCGCQHSAENAPKPSLDFFQNGALVRSVQPQSLPSLRRVVTFDPYYGKEKAFLAVPLRDLLLQGFAGRELRSEQIVLRCRDGYLVPTTGQRLLEEGAFVAVGEAGAAVWESIGPQHVDPRPFYLFWTGSHQQNIENYPRPWQITGIELARFETLFPHVIPNGVAADAQALRGLTLFRAQCIRCHAINREGGRIGPDLNVPQSIVEYRPVQQIRDYIVNPQRFRYSNMPPHPHLTAADLDALVAYFVAMKDHKYDPAPGK